MNKKYAMFVGRWQPFHEGHQWLIDQQLNKGNNVLLLIRDTPQDENNPYTADQVLDNLVEKFGELMLEGRMRAIIIPDIESINYGRGVGYEIIEHIPPKQIEQVSATKIREKLRKDGKL